MLSELVTLEKSIKNLFFLVLIISRSVSDPDPYHLVGSGSGSVSGNVDMDPGSAKN